MKKKDEVQTLILAEEKRQQETFTLIPSENYASRAVRNAVGSVFMNKYSEGLPYKRYYQGNQNVDELEALTQKRALAVFKLDSTDWSVNVQALSGSPANLAVYNALLEPGETIMSMYLPDGGHLSHGWQLPGKKLTFVSKIWNIGFYHVDPKTRVFDYDELAKQAVRLKPKLIISGGTAYPREIDHRRMADIARSINAYYLADIAHEAGLVAGGANSSPFPFADIVTMTTHKTLRGPRGALIFARNELSDRINSSVFPGLQGGPHNHTIAGIAVALGEAETPEFSRYARQVVTNARVLACVFREAGLDVVTDGTDKHLVLLDFTRSGISAWVAAWALEYAGIIVNRNTVPNETGSSFYPSGLRMGTPAITTRGMKEAETEKVAGFVLEVINHVKGIDIPVEKESRKLFLAEVHKRLQQDGIISNVRAGVAEMAASYPIP